MAIFQLKPRWRNLGVIPCANECHWKLSLKCGRFRHCWTYLEILMAGPRLGGGSYYLQAFYMYATLPSKDVKLLFHTMVPWQCTERGLLSCYRPVNHYLSVYGTTLWHSWTWTMAWVYKMPGYGRHLNGQWHGSLLWGPIDIMHSIMSSGFMRKSHGRS